MISYAQNFEDVMINRLFEPGYQGFYIDVGAADPTRLSVTRHFYESGWRGINIEPLPRFSERLRAARPEDINLQVAVGTPSRGAQFFEILELSENSTTDVAVMNELKRQGRSVRAHNIDILSLAEICAQHCNGRRIDFLKIDVEGSENDVLQSADWDKYRPVLLVVEATAVNDRDETWQEWEHIVTAARYEKVWFDGLNNFYLAQENSSLKKHFVLPPNIFDKFSFWQGEDIEDPAAPGEPQRLGATGGNEALRAALAVFETAAAARLELLEATSADDEVLRAALAASESAAAARLDLLEATTAANAVLRAALAASESAAAARLVSLEATTAANEVLRAALARAESSCRPA